MGSTSVGARHLKCFSSRIMFAVVVMDKDNAVAEGGLDAAMKYLDKNSGAKIGKKSAVEVEGEEAYVTVEKGNIALIDFFNSLDNFVSLR